MAALERPLPPTDAPEKENIERAIKGLEPHFTITREVWLRHPLTGADHRVDLIAEPAGDFPFPFLAIEVKGMNGSNGHFERITQALKQCVDYRACVVNDRRLTRLRGMWVPAVALYNGNAPWPDERWVERLVGKWNVGKLQHEWNRGLTLRISAESIWDEQRGVSGVGALWPVARRVGNSTRRDQQAS